MNGNEKIVTEQPEVVEQVAEQPTPKMYTQDEVNEMMGKRLARQEAKLRKETERKYGGLMEVLKAGTGKESVEEVQETFTKFYEGKGIKVRKQPEYSDKDLEVLAKSDAEEFITAGFEDVVEEVDRLAEIGVENMTAREKALFRNLAEYRQNTERGKALSERGVTEDEYNSAEFKAFAAKFTHNTPITEIYDLYQASKPNKKEHRTMGSMKSSTPAETGVKDYYSFEEASKFTKADFDKNPELYKKVQESMTKWK